MQYCSVQLSSGRRQQERGERRGERGGGETYGATVTVTVWSGPWILGPVCDDISKEYVHLTHVHLYTRTPHTPAPPPIFEMQLLNEVEYKAIPHYRAQFSL
jgi:hypothetical protein